MLDVLPLSLDRF